MVRQGNFYLLIAGDLALTLMANKSILELKIQVAQKNKDLKHLLLGCGCFFSKNWGPSKKCPGMLGKF